MGGIGTSRSNNDVERDGQMMSLVKDASLRGDFQGREGEAGSVQIACSEQRPGERRIEQQHTSGLSVALSLSVLLTPRRSRAKVDAQCKQQQKTRGLSTIQQSKTATPTFQSPPSSSCPAQAAGTETGTHKDRDSGRKGVERDWNRRNRSDSTRRKHGTTGEATQKWG